MAIRKIVQIGDDILRKKCFEVTDFGPKTWQLLDDMRDTLIKAEGAGLAAPQVGVLRRIFILDVDGQYYEMLNPVILEQSGTQYGVEGCLSVVGKWGDVKRPKKLTIKYQDRNGNFNTLVAEDFLAKAICHENDHLNGVLYVDKADNLRTEV